jgi:Zn-dependent peptidase ImmA (M78 family)
MTEKKDTFLEIIQKKNLVKINAGYRSFRLDIKRGLKEEGDKCFGVTDFDKGTITLERDMDSETARETLLHELTHIALELCGLGGEETTDIVKEHTNEEITTRVSRSLLLLMNLNKDIFEVLLNEST